MKIKSKSGLLINGKPAPRWVVPALWVFAIFFIIGIPAIFYALLCHYSDTGNKDAAFNCFIALCIIGGMWLLGLCSLLWNAITYVPRD